MRWRLIPYSEHGPEWNMAIDEAIFGEFIEGNCSPTLRFYGWNEPCVTIGRLQPAESVPEGWGTRVTRRPTGGRAVRHANELTFSIVVPASVLGSPVRESYRRTGEAVARALQSLGIAAEMCRNTTPAATVRGIGNCFALTLDYELAVGGRKVLGSAQVRRAGAVLQQNSLVIPMAETESGRGVLMRAIVCSITAEYGADIQEEVLSETELQNAREIAEKKYAIECRMQALL